MNEREKFEAWANTNNVTEHVNVRDEAYLIYEAGAESKQAELDKANARIAQLEEALKVYLQAGVCQSTDFHLQLKANRLARAVSESSDTWLLEHDKAVEIKVLEEADNKCLNLPASADTVMDCSEVLGEMIKSRK